MNERGAARVPLCGPRACALPPATPVIITESLKTLHPVKAQARCMSYLFHDILYRNAGKINFTQKLSGLVCYIKYEFLYCSN